jgi:hypothetical protein
MRKKNLDLVMISLMMQIEQKPKNENKTNALVNKCQGINLLILNAYIIKKIFSVFKKLKFKFYLFF